jgi:hypothetical protein
MQPETPADHSEQSTFNQLAALVEPQLGANLAFAGHEDGGLLEPFIWHQAQGEFSSLALMQVEGWCSELPVAEALQEWQQPERVGAVGGADWLVPERDPAQILPSPTLLAEHQALDAELLELLQSRLQNLQAFKLSCDPGYAFVLLVGQIEQDWIGIAPTVPIATDLTSDPDLPLSLTPIPLVANSTADLADSVSMLQLQIQDKLTRRGSVRLYGYYGGGYNQTHEYRLVQTIGQSKTAAVESLMQETGLLQIGRFEALQSDSAAAQLEPLNHLLQSLQPLVYQFSFWDWEQVYVIGEAPALAGDRTGVVLRSHFTYNP